MHSSEAFSNWYASVFLSESYSAEFNNCVGVWALVQDYKFYNAEGGGRRGNWNENVAFRAGAMQGYQAVRGTLSNLELEETKKKSGIEIVEITDDSESESDSGGDQLPMEADVETSRWTTRGEDLSNFLPELKEIADRESHGRDEALHLPPDCQMIDSDRDNIQDIHELCADVNRMHRSIDHDSVQKIDYEFSWTGM